METKNAYLEAFSSTCAILLSFAIVGTVAPAEAGIVTADSQAWVNDGLTGEVGANYRSFDVKAVKQERRIREIVVPPTPDRVIEVDGTHVTIPGTPATTRQETFFVNTPFTKRITGLNGAGKVSGRISSDVLLSIGYDQNLNASASVKNGTLVGTVGSTFNGQLFGTVALSPFKNVALFADMRRSQTSYGTQLQLGDTNVHYAYSPATQGHSIGLAFEIGSRPTTRDSNVSNTRPFSAVENVLVPPAPCKNGEIPISQGSGFYCLPGEGAVKGRG